LSIVLRTVPCESMTVTLPVSLVTHMFIPSNAMALGTDPGIGKTPTSDAGEATENLETLAALRFVTHMFAPSKAIPRGS